MNSELQIALAKIELLVQQPAPATERLTSVCGALQAFIVEDVGSDPRYLACNLETRSEIVFPIIRGDVYLAQIDVDSDTPAAFGADDEAFLRKVATLLEPLF